MSFSGTMHRNNDNYFNFRHKLSEKRQKLFSQIKISHGSSHRRHCIKCHFEFQQVELCRLPGSTWNKKRLRQGKSHSRNLKRVNEQSRHRMISEELFVRNLNCEGRKWRSLFVEIPASLARVINVEIRAHWSNETWMEIVKIRFKI